MHVGNRLRQRRKEKQVSQGQLAAALGRTFQQVQKYEIGANRISASVLFDAAQFLDTPIEWFFDGFTADGCDLPENTVDRSEFWASREGQAVFDAFPRIDDAHLRAHLAGFVTGLVRR